MCIGAGEMAFEGHHRRRLFSVGRVSHYTDSYTRVLHHYRSPVSSRISCLAKKLLFFFPKISIDDIVVSRSLTHIVTLELTHRNTQTTNRNLNTAYGNKSRLDTAVDKPVVRSEGQAEAEDVLEDEEAGETLGHR